MNLFKNKKFFIPLFLIPVAFLTFTITQLQFDLRQNASEKKFLYVSTLGNDSNPGSQTLPIATIGKAASLATPNTDVIVMPGTYNETVITRISGTALEPITFRSEKKWEAKIVSFGNTESTQATWENNGNYIIIEDFDISGGQRIGIINRGSESIIVGNRVHDVAVGYCQNLGGAGISSAFTPEQKGNVYARNVVENVGPKPCSYVHGIYTQSLKESVINNIVINNGGIGIVCTHGCNSAIISNNTILNNGFGLRIGWSRTDPVGKTENSVISNNIIAGHQGYTVYQYLPGLGVNNLFTNNLFFANKTNACSSPTGSTPIECINTTVQDPQFINYNSLLTSFSSIDAHLKPTSPAIDRGTDAPFVNVDFENNPRPQNSTFDIGAYEYASVTPTPQPIRITDPTPTKSQPTPTPIQKIKGDINSDGTVNNKDYSALVACWGKKTTACKSSDLNLDGNVNSSDLNILLREMFKLK